MRLSTWQKVALVGAGGAGGYRALTALRRLRARQAAGRASGTEPPPGTTRVVILGAGFAGVYAARELARRFRRPEDCHITLVDQHNFFLFTPMLTEVVGGEVDAREIVSSIRRLSPRVTFLQGRVEGIDVANRRVSLTIGGSAAGIPTARRTLEADQLVIALGSVTNFHHIAGLREHALTIKRVADAQAIHDRALALLERADVEPDQTIRRELLTFVVGGGGFSGVETMAALNDLVRGSAPEYPHVAPEDMRTILVEPGERLLPELSADLAAYALRKLRERGVEVILKTGIAGASADAVDLEGQARIAAHTLIWTGGVTPSSVIGAVDARHGHHGAIVVDACCRVPDHPGVWAVGDCAEVPQPGARGRTTYAPTAQDATREGTRVARNVAAVLRGEEPRPFVYHPIGELALVGRRSGVASVYGVHVSGLLAWLMWRAIYLAKQPSPSRRILTGVSWLIDFVFGRQLAAVGGRQQPTEADVEPAGHRVG